MKKILMGDYIPPKGILWDKIQLLGAGVIEQVTAGYQVLLGENATITVLSPEHAAEGGENNDSLVLMLTIGMQKFLFTGDLEQEGEERLLTSYPAEALRADVLKVGHHGSNGSTGDAFLEAVNPRIAVISVAGDNAFGHPGFDLLDRLETQGAKILRTDQEGTIRMRCDGVRLYLKQ